jgi:hypothetical protein
VIDIRSSPSTADCPSDNRVSIVLFATLAFVTWDSGYLGKWFPSQDRTDQAVSATAVLLIKSPDMTVDQQYTASSPVLDEIADQRGIKFRVIDDAPGEISGSPDWLQSLFLKYESKSPCIAIMDASGNSKSFDAPSSVSEFRKRIGAK